MAGQAIVAALYVLPDGPYSGLPGVDPWPESRDARRYAGPHPVVAHPPCARWGRYWSGGPSWIAAGNPRKQLGDDGGCFAAALESVRRWGGVLEHPADSKAWAHFGLNPPPRYRGWVVADFEGGWTCRVEQGWYGHPARKATWLYANAVELPELQWGHAPGFARLDDKGFRAAQERRRAVRTGVCQRLSHRQRALTPPAFRDVLLDIARSARLSSPDASARPGPS